VTSKSFDFAPLLAAGLPPAAARWTGRAKLVTLMESLKEHFGASVEFDDPKGGIFLWVKLPDGVATLKLYQPALAAGVVINPGPEWSVNNAHARSRMRLCFASLSHEEIHQGVAALADVCRKEFGVPR
jgi:2-aminoadipate transaminase